MQSGAREAELRGEPIKRQVQLLAERFQFGEIKPAWRT
jgi:hypothetical protein